MNSSNVKNRSLRDILGNTRLRTVLTALGLLIAAVVTYVFLNMKLASGDMTASLFEGRNFMLQPFDLMDAHDVCKLQAQKKFGESLLRYTVNPLSTRYQEKKKNYFVVSDADIGTVEAWEEIMILCDVDPISHSVSYLKVVHNSDSSIFLKAKSMFKKMVN